MTQPNGLGFSPDGKTLYVSNSMPDMHVRAYDVGPGGKLSNMKNEFTGNGPFLHNDPRDRPIAIYSGKTTLHLGGGRENFVLLPVIPPKDRVVGRAVRRAKRALKNRR
jgi:hypothetical protein